MPMRDTDREDIRVRSKHLALRVTVFVLAVLIAVGAFAYGITGLGRKKPGYYRVEATEDEELLRLNGRINFQYLFSGSNAEIGAELRQLQALYGASLRRGSRLLDPSSTYVGVINPAELNANLGRDISLSDELFETLTDAYAKTQERQGYNLFAGPLYAEWNSILILENPEPFDPIRNTDEAARIARLSELVNDLDNFTFEIVDAEKHTVRFDVSEEVLSCMREFEMECPILDLNLLHDAYLLRLIARDLEKQGYANGFLAAASGVTLSLSGHSGGEYSLIGFDGKFRETAAAFPLDAGSACSLRLAFAPEEGSYGYYVSETEDGILFRHPNVPATGEYPGVLLSCAVRCADGEPVRAAYESLRLFSCTDQADAETGAAGFPDAAAWTLQGKGERVFSNPAAESILRDGDYGWTLE